MTVSDTHYEHLRRQLIDAARDFVGNPRKLDRVLLGITEGIRRAADQPLEIFPVCHHSPASALFMIQRLLEKRPKVIFMELCEDLRPLLDHLRQCRLPVALQAFASELVGLPKSQAPLSVVAPISEFSAEYQVISYALEQPDCELVLVDRSVDHIFQWQPQEDAGTEEAHKEQPPEEEAGMHGSAVGLAMGELRPDFAEFEQALLASANVRHYSEWWELYVEEALVGQPYETYRSLMFMIGGLFRQLRMNTKRLAEDEARERYMWQRIKTYLQKHRLAVESCLYVCGAFHAVSDVEEFGVEAKATCSIEPRTATKWLYGVIPSSYSAIEWQFSLASGTMSIASANWQKSAKKLKLKPFKLAKKAGKTKSLPKHPKKTATEKSFSDFVSLPPKTRAIDQAELADWSAEIVRLARKNGYLASTADAIAIYQHARMLAHLRNRVHPTPYDFQDAAVTCLEKEMTPRKRDIRRLCEILLGGDRIGQVGYNALPPLAQDVHQRLAPLNINLSVRTIRRVLLDFTNTPELLPCSELLWKLRYLLGDNAARPIMGECRLGFSPKQESWDVAIGKHQRAIIELGYEGVTVEQVLEKRLMRAVYARNASSATALEAVEESILFLKSRRLTHEIGKRAVALMVREESARNAPAIFKRIRILLNYYRTSEPEIPAWINDFVVKGYSHYCTLLPQAFAEEETLAHEISAMLGFILTMESLALSLGCNREQFRIALAQSQPAAPAKKSLLWAAECMLEENTLSGIRGYLDHVLATPLLLDTFPEYIGGLVLALEFSPSMGRFVAEMMSKAFGQLTDGRLYLWLPRLIMTLRRYAGHLMPDVIKEAEQILPDRLSKLDSWRPGWELPDQPSLETKAPNRSPRECCGRDLLATHPATCNAMASLLGLKPVWREKKKEKEQPPTRFPDSKISACRTLLEQYPDTCRALGRLIKL